MSNEPTEFNPYQPASGSVGQNADQAFLARTASELARWQTFFAILMTIAVVGMLGMFAISLLGAGGQDVASAIGGMACIGGASLLIYGLPAIMLWKAASGARNYARSPDNAQLAQFTSSQLVFWRTVGIIAAIVLGLYAMIFVGAIFFGAMAFM